MRVEGVVESLESRVSAREVGARFPHPAGGDFKIELFLRRLGGIIAS